MKSIARRRERWGFRKVLSIRRTKLYNLSMRYAWFLIFSFLLASCGPGKLFGPTITLTPTFTSTPTITSTSTPTSTNEPPTPTFTITPIPLPQEIATQLQDTGIIFEEQDGQIVLSTFNSKGEKDILPGKVELTDGKWFLKIEYKGLNGKAETAVPLEGVQKYHNEDFKIDEIVVPTEGEGKITFIPPYYKGVEGHWVEDKIGEFGPILVDPRYLFDGDIIVKDQEAAQSHYDAIWTSLIKMAYKWYGASNPDPHLVAGMVELARKNQLPADFRIFPERSGAVMNENETPGLGLIYFKMSSLGILDTSKISLRILYTEEMTQEYGGIRKTENPAISVRGMDFAMTVCSFETVTFDGKNILQLTISGYMPWTITQVNEVSDADQWYILPFQRPDGVNPNRVPTVEINSANIGVYGLETFFGETWINTKLSALGYRYFRSYFNAYDHELDVLNDPLFILP
jgi:hypothetical protein